MTSIDKNNLLRSIPAMEELLNTDWAAEYINRMGREQVKRIIHEAIGDVRNQIRHTAHEQSEIPVSELTLSRAITLLELRSSSTLKAVVNATGVVIHTNLGRAPLAEEVIKAVNDLVGRYNTLEYSPEIGGRGGRNAHIEWLLRYITGAEAALVVNNNAAAVLLALSATAAGREVIVSAGELVEIGDSFRIPDILSFSGAAMCIVGCTNATRIGDYRKAITEKTAVLLKVHPSNYQVAGFTTTTSREELAKLASSRGLIFIEDLGSGLLSPLNVPFAEQEPTVRDCLEAGSGIITFSGDKLLGGPQIGVIAGSKKYIDKMRSHQLCRALRVDKMTLAAFEATLRLYITGRQQEIPVIRMIEMDEDASLKKARNLSRKLRQSVKDLNADGFEIEVVEAGGIVGGGAFPTNMLPGFGVEIRSATHNADSLAKAFRSAKTPVIPGFRDGQLILHVRTLLEGDERIITSTFTEIIEKKV